MVIFNNPGLLFSPEKIIGNILPSQRLLFSLHSKSSRVGDGRRLFHVLLCEASVSEVWGVFCCFIFLVEQISSAALWQHREGRTVPVWSTNGLSRSWYLGPSACLMNDGFVVHRTFRPEECCLIIKWWMSSRSPFFFFKPEHCCFYIPSSSETGSCLIQMDGMSPA